MTFIISLILLNICTVVVFFAIAYIYVKNSISKEVDKIKVIESNSNTSVDFSKTLLENIKDLKKDIDNRLVSVDNNLLKASEISESLNNKHEEYHGDMLEKLSQHSQLIIVTHNRETMSRADILYGVTIGNDGSSKLLSVKLDEAAAIAK